jgi:hypothetical protein
MTKRQLNVRLSDELWEKIDSSGKTPTEIVTAALQSYFDGDTLNDTATQSAIQSKTEEIQTLKTDNERMVQEIHYKDELVSTRDRHIKDLQNQIGWMQHEFAKFDQFLLPETTSKRRWWEIWK